MSAGVATRKRCMLSLGPGTFAERRPKRDG
jgi:hypothetical protein